MTREEIIELKEKRGYSVAKLSEYSGVPVGTIRKIITGESKNPRAATLNALEKVLVGDETIYSGKSFEYEEQASVNIVCEEPAEYVCGSVAFNGNVTEKKQGEYTVDDYFALPDGDRKELIDGVFYDMVTPFVDHQEIIGTLFYYIKKYINSNKGKCHVCLSRSAVQLNCDDKTMVEPDLYIICERDKIKRFGIYGAPDFILEVLSDSTRKKDLTIKLYKYINAGVKEIWYIDLKSKKLITYFIDDDYIPCVHLLEGMVGVSMYGGKLQIDLSEIGQIIEEYSELPDA